MIALKTILKEIDPVSFDESLKMSPGDKKHFAVKQDDEDRKSLDKKWDKLSAKIKTQMPGYTDPILPFRSSNLIRDYNELYKKIYDKEKLI